MSTRDESQYITTFEIRRNGYPVVRVEQDSKRHGAGELCVLFYSPEGEQAQRMTIDELEEALKRARDQRCKLEHNEKPVLHGYEPWDVEMPYTKASMTRFMRAFILTRSYFTSSFAIGDCAPRDSVFMRVWVQRGSKEQFESIAKCELEPPPVLQLNSAKGQVAQ